MNKRLVVIGVTGSGKSTLCNILAGKKPGDSLFPVGHTLGSQTRTTTVKEAQWNGNGFKIDIIDTPGLDDPKGVEEDSKNISDMVTKLKALEYVNTFLIVFNVAKTRLDRTMGELLQIFQEMFGPGFLANTIFVCTNWSYDKKAIKVRLNQNQKTEITWQDDLNHRLREFGLRPSQDIHAVFIDSMYEADDSKERDEFERNMGRLSVIVQNSRDYPCDKFLETKRDLQKKEEEALRNKLEKEEAERKTKEVEELAQRQAEQAKQQADADRKEIKEAKELAQRQAEQAKQQADAYQKKIKEAKELAQRQAEQAQRQAEQAQRQAVQKEMEEAQRQAKELAQRQAEQAKRQADAYQKEIKEAKELAQRQAEQAQRQAEQAKIQAVQKEMKEAQRQAKREETSFKKKTGGILAVIGTVFGIGAGIVGAVVAAPVVLLVAAVVGTVGGITAITGLVKLRPVAEEED